MPKFNFRLQSYLTIKEKLEEQKKLEYGKAIKVLETEKQKKLALQSENARNIGSMRNKLESGVLPFELNSYNKYIDFTNKRIVKQTEVIVNEEKNVEAKRKLLVEAMKDRKALDILKEKSFEEYKEEEKKLEFKLVDEITSYKYSKVEE